MLPTTTNADLDLHCSTGVRLRAEQRMNAQTQPKQDEPLVRHSHARIDSIDWARALPFVNLFSAVHAGLRPSRVVFAFFILLTVVAAGRFWDGFAPASSPPEGLLAGPLREKQLVDSLDAVRTIVVPELLAQDRGAAGKGSLDDIAVCLLRAAESGGEGSMDPERYSSLARMIDAARPRGSFDALHEAIRTSFYEMVRAVVHADPSLAFDSGLKLVRRVPTHSWDAAPWFTVLFALTCIIVVGWGAGVLCRVSAGDLSARGWSLAQAREFIQPRFSTLIGAPIFAAALAWALWIPAWILGLLVNVPIFDVVAGVLFGAALGFAALSALIVAVLIVGFPLIAPAVACDGCDAVESIQRAGAYMLARPLHLLWYVVLSIVVVSLGTVVADGAATAMWSLGTGAYESASGEPVMHAVATLRFLEPVVAPPPTALGLTQAMTASFIDMWRTILGLFIGASVFSIVASCATRTYLLLRGSADGQDLCDLWLDSDETSNS